MCFVTNTLHVLSSISPDLNLCENVGSMLKGLVRSARPVIESRTDLRNSLVAAHQQMTTTLGRKYFIDLVESMPRRLAAVRAANGGHTRY